MSIKRILVVFPEDQLECMATMTAMQVAISDIPVDVEFDALVFNSTMEDLLKATCLAKNVGLYTSYKDVLEEFPDLHEDYAIVFVSSPCVETGVNYGEEEQEKSIEKMLKVLGTPPEQEIPVQNFNLLATTVCDLGNAITLAYKPNFNIQDHIKMSTLTPFVKTTNVARKSLQKKLRKTILAHDGMEVKNDAYIVFSLFGSSDSSSDTLRLKNEFIELAETSKSPVILLEESGKIVGCDETLSTLEQVALVEAEQCMCVLGSGWHTYASWRFNKKLTIQLLLDSPNAYWMGSRNNNTLLFPMDVKPLSELKELIPKIEDHCLSTQ